MPVLGIRLQPRDLAFLSELGEVGLLDSATLRERHFSTDRTGKACLRRLALYARHGLVQPIVPSVSFGLPRGGRLPGIHGLTPRGADVLAAVTGESVRRALKGSPKPETILHRLGCAKLHLLVRDACRIERLNAPVWIAEYDSVPGVGLHATLAERFVLCHSYRLPDGAKHTCWPDAAALVQIPAVGPASVTTYPLVILIEYDRSTETLKQFARKLPGYHLLLTRGDWQKFWPDLVKPTVRVFVVTQSMERLRTIVAAIRDRPGADAVRLAALQQLRPDTFFAAPIWQTVKGDNRSILRTSSNTS